MGPKRPILLVNLPMAPALGGSYPLEGPELGPHPRISKGIEPMF